MNQNIESAEINGLSFGSEINITKKINFDSLKLFKKLLENNCHLIFNLLLVNIVEISNNLIIKES